MKIRQLVAGIIKLFGLFMAASAISTIAELLGPYVESHVRIVTPLNETIAMTTYFLLGRIAIAAVCIAFAEPIANWSFDDEEIPAIKLSQRDGLFIGVALFGLIYVVTRIP